MSKHIRTKVIILRRTNFKDYDRIIQFLTPQGQMPAIAKGVRCSKSKLAGGLELFSISDVNIVQGRSDLGTITSARLIKYYDNIIKDYQYLELAYLILKKINQFSRDIDDQDWFLILEQLLEALNDNFDLRLIEAWFYIQAAEILGQGINLKYDRDNNLLEANKTYQYDSESQTFFVSENGMIKVNHLKILRLLLNHNLKVINQIKNLEPFLDQVLLVSKQNLGV